MLQKRLSVTAPVNTNIFSPQEPVKGTDCSICFERLSEPSNASVIGHIANGVMHQFHEPCITEWLRTRSICPICRVSIGDPEQDEERPGGLPQHPEMWALALEGNLEGVQGLLAANEFIEEEDRRDASRLAAMNRHLAVLQILMRHGILSGEEAEREMEVFDDPLHADQPALGYLSLRLSNYRMGLMGIALVVFVATVTFASIRGSS